MTSGIATQKVVNQDETLYRRIHKSWIEPNENGTFRVCSAAYRDENASVDIASKTDPKTSIRGSDALAGLLAKIPLDLGHNVVEDSLPENPAHALILGKKTRSNARIMANASQWVIPPQQS